jgi:hypothetical protein
LYAIGEGAWHGREDCCPEIDVHEVSQRVKLPALEDGLDPGKGLRQHLLIVDESESTIVSDPVCGARNAARGAQWQSGQV